MADIFIFYSRSLDDAPGCGTKEQVQNVDKYRELSKIVHWRRILSNFHVCQFKYNGYTYNTIEHAFQAAKIALVSPARALDFAVESNSDLARGNGFDARKARKLVSLDESQLILWNSMKAEVIADIASEKYKQCPLARLVLKETKDAQLWHLQYRQPMVRFKHLELIRQRLLHH